MWIYIHRYVYLHACIEREGERDNMPCFYAASPVLLCRPHFASSRRKKGAAPAGHGLGGAETARREAGLSGAQRSHRGECRPLYR